MKFIPEILLVSLVFFLYTLFVYAKDNFILLRKNVTLEYLFNITFIGFLIAIFSARIVYVLEHLSLRYLNPLVLLLFPYFPGLSVGGGIIGFILFTYLITKRKKFPFWNILDIFSLSLLFSSGIGMLVLQIVNLFFTRKISAAFIGGMIGLLIVFTILSLLYAQNSLKDGSLGLLAFAFLSLIQEMVLAVIRGKTAFSVSHIVAEDVLLGLLTIVFLLLLMQRQLSKKK